MYTQILHLGNKVNKNKDCLLPLNFADTIQCYNIFVKVEQISISCCVIRFKVWLIELFSIVINLMRRGV